MEEKILIESEKQSSSAKRSKLLKIGLILYVITIFIVFFNSINYYNSYYGEDHEHSKYCYSYEYQNDYYDDIYGRGFQEYKSDCYQVVYGDAMSYALANVPYLMIRLAILYAVIIGFISLIILLLIGRCELTVTDKRITGKVRFGKRVDLPLDSISAAAEIRLLNGISISTSSGRISFYGIKNAKEIYTVITNLLIERQQNAKNVTYATVTPKSDEADQLKKYKELLDSGIITQEEFDAKKKQLLGL